MPRLQCARPPTPQPAVLHEGALTLGRGRLPFKKRAFQMAIAVGVHIVPIGCNDCKRTMRLNRWRSGPLRIRALPPISTEVLRLDDAPTLMKIVQGADGRVCRHLGCWVAGCRPTDNGSRETMKTYLKSVLIDRREGLVTCLGSLVYLALGLVAKFAPTASPIPPFYGMLSLFVPLALGLAYLQMGGFGKKFESSAFNTAILVLTALVPVFVAVKSALHW